MSNSQKQSRRCVACGQVVALKSEHEFHRHFVSAKRRTASAGRAVLCDGRPDDVVPGLPRIITRAETELST